MTRRRARAACGSGRRRQPRHVWSRNGWCFGSTTEGLLRRSDVSVFVMPPEWTPPTAVESSISPAPDRSSRRGPDAHSSIAAARAACRLAAALGTAVEAIHVVPELAVLARWRPHAVRVLDDRVAESRQKLETIVRGLACPVADRLEGRDRFGPRSTGGDRQARRRSRAAARARQEGAPIERWCTGDNRLSRAVAGECTGADVRGLIDQRRDQGAGGVRGDGHDAPEHQHFNSRPPPSIARDRGARDADSKKRRQREQGRP